MLILWKARQKDPGLGYATTFLRQTGGGARHLPGARRQGRRQRRRPQPGGPGREDHRALRPARPEHPGRLRHRRRPDPGLDDLQAAGHEFANLDTGLPLAKADLPVVTANAYLGGWGITAALAGRRGRRRLPAGHRRERGHRTRRLVARLAPGRLGRPRRRGRRRARHRVRPAGHRRQLQVPGRDHRPPLPRLPDRRGRRRRQQRHHQARRHRRRRLGRHRHRPAALRDRRARLPQPRRRRALRHHPAGPARTRTGSR